jgi:hypothetical protein
MEKKKQFQGYLECDGAIVKISSFEDIESFICRFGKTINDISELDIDKLLNKDGETIIDDCGVCYITNPLILKRGSLIESYKIKEGTLVVSNNAFSFNDGILKSIFIPDTVIGIGHSAFLNQSLSNLRLSEILIKIGDYAFRNCSNLSSVSLPSTLMYIGKEAFYNCSITHIVIPNSVVTIGAHAFSENMLLNQVYFEGVPKEISSGIFDKCKSLKKIIVPSGTKDYFEKELFPMEHDIIIEQ